MNRTDRNSLVQQLKTIAAIPVTPFHPDGTVDWENYDRVVRRIVAGLPGRLQVDEGEFVPQLADGRCQLPDAAAVAGAGRERREAGDEDDLHVLLAQLLQVDALRRLPDQLVEQMHRDVAQAREICARASYRAA